MTSQQPLSGAAPHQPSPDPVVSSFQPDYVLRLRVNGEERAALIRPYATLLDVLRDDLHLTGTKRGCDLGTCGCCTVQVDGVPTLSCLTLAAQVADRNVTTIEGLANEEGLHPVQEAFASCGGSQCGFCTPGFIMTVSAFLAQCPNPTEEQLREAVSGNLCRCTGYVKIFDAVRAAAKALREGAPRRPLDRDHEHQIGELPPGTRTDPRTNDLARLRHMKGEGQP